MTLTYALAAFPIAFIAMIGMVLVGEYLTSKKTYTHWLTEQEEIEAAKQITDRLEEEATS